MLTVAASALPEPPISLEANWGASSMTSLHISWKAPATLPASLITGYSLEMDDGIGGQFKEVCETDNNNLFCLVTGLQTGALYRFRAYSINFNGKSTASSTVQSYYACTEPSLFAAPTVYRQTSSQVTIRFTAPKNNGGCRILSYRVLRDSGMQDEISHEVAASSSPSLNEVVISDLPSQGLTYRVQVEVTTVQHTSKSQTLFFVFAGVPSMPTDKPTSDPTVTSDRVIKVSFANPQPQDNGSAILSYSLEIDDGKSGLFKAVSGLEQDQMLSEFTITEGIIKGRKHRLRYRARNSVGWGPYSEVAFVLAATKPSVPPHPYFLTFANDEL